MLRSNPLPQFAAAVLLLALAGCDVDKIDLADGIAPVVSAVSVPPLGQEIFRMVAAERQSGPAAQPCAQF